MEVDAASRGGPSEPPAVQAAARKTPSSGAPKKLVIKPFKEKPKLPENFEAETWAKLQAAVHAVHAKRPVAFSFEQLYRCCEDLVLHKLGAGLYARLTQEVDTHVAAQLTLLAADATPDPVAFLARVDATWQDHCDAMHTLRSIFLVLDRAYVLPQPGVRPLWEAGLGSLRAALAARPALAQRTVKGLLTAIERERAGEGGATRPLLKSLLRLLSALGIYGDSFERLFLAETAAFYATEAAAALADRDAAAYLAHAEARLTEEAERCAAVLDAATRKPLLAAVEKALVAEHLPALLEKGFAPLMAAARVPDLARLYALAGRVGGHDALRGAFSAYVKATGARLVTDTAKDAEMVPALLELKATLDGIHRDAFAGADAFGHALKDAFETFINARANKPAELVAKYIDAALRAGNKGSTEEELEALLDRVLILFRYISGKDVFEAFYKKDLAKRLLLGKSASIDAEKSMIAKLKAECGAQFTTKLEGMFKDVDTSRDVAAAFRNSPAAKRVPAGVEIAVSVLTAGYWPTYPAAEVTLPADVAAYTELFTQFYLSKHSGRRLAWQHSLGQCVLRATFASCGARELQVSLFQAAVLLLFNDAPKLSFLEIRAATGIEDKELRRTLQSLACAKVRVLTKTPKGAEVGDTDAFEVNDALAEPRFRIKINTVQGKESAEEAAVTNEKVFQDRQYQIDAAIVRIMKTRKTLAHTALVNELMAQLKFPVKREDLKKRIESLLDREYLERDASAPSTYNYLA